jgi:NADH-quinone oxidoreductase subunit B
MAIEGVLQEGFVTTTADKLINYVRTGSMWPMTFGLGLLCRRNDSCGLFAV